MLDRRERQYPQRQAGLRCGSCFVVPVEPIMRQTPMHVVARRSWLPSPHILYIQNADRECSVPGRGISAIWCDRPIPPCSHAAQVLSRAGHSDLGRSDPNRAVAPHGTPHNPAVILRGPATFQRPSPRCRHDPLPGARAVCIPHRRTCRRPAGCGFRLPGGAGFHSLQVSAQPGSSTLIGKTGYER